VWVNQGRQEWVYEEGEWDHVVFLAGGTGITPAFQLCLAALQRQKYREQADPAVKKTRFSILASARESGSVLLRDDFEAMRQNYGDGYLDVRYFLDNVPKDGKLPKDVHAGPITEKILQETIRSGKSGGWFSRSSTSKAGEKKDEKVMVLICGPDGFTRYISGDHGGVISKQGPKGGLLEKIEGIEVFKMLESRDDAAVDPPKQRRRIPVMKVE
jgi:cytochrome-b5 reductase